MGCLRRCSESITSIPTCLLPTPKPITLRAAALPSSRLTTCPVSRQPSFGGGAASVQNTVGQPACASSSATSRDTPTPGGALRS